MACNPVLTFPESQSRTTISPLKGGRARFNKGFSLLEVIVALSILAVCVSVLMRVFSGAVASTQTSSVYYTALELAESQLAALTAKRHPLGIGSGETDDGYRWHTEVTEYIPARDNPLFESDLYQDTEFQFIAYHFYVEVSWGRQKSSHLELSTLRLGRRD